ncbi:hypothetical protein GEMRC1_012024 [Eukaryota sp. GEM-RC1]
MLGLLYSAALLTKIGDRAWDMIIPIYLASFFPDDLTAPSVIALTEALILTLFSTSIGSFISRQSSRLKTVIVFIFCQSLCVVASFGSLLLLHNFSESSFMFLPLVLTLSLAEAGSTLTSKGTDISLTRDWLPLLVSSDDHLTSSNAIVARIDLGTKILSPVVAGLVFQFLGPSISLYSVAILNMVSFFPEALLLQLLSSRAGDKLSVSIAQELKIKKPSKLSQIKRTSSNHDLNPPSLLSLLSHFYFSLYSLLKEF